VKTPSDNAAPSIPANVKATPVSSSQAKVTWDTSQDQLNGSDVKGYKVFLNGVFSKQVTGTFAYISGLEEEREYSFSVSAIDVLQNESSKSAMD